MLLTLDFIKEALKWCALEVLHVLDLVHSALIVLIYIFLNGISIGLKLFLKLLLVFLLLIQTAFKLRLLQDLLRVLETQFV